MRILLFASLALATLQYNEYDERERRYQSPHLELSDHQKALLGTIAVVGGTKLLYNMVKGASPESPTPKPLPQSVPRSRPSSTFVELVPVLIIISIAIILLGVAACYFSESEPAQPVVMVTL